MFNIGRMLGTNIYILMINSGMSCEELAERLNYTYRDMCRILEGKLILPPVEIEKIANLFGTTKKELLRYKDYKFCPRLSNSDNLNKILDLMDEYIELKEACT